MFFQSRFLDLLFLIFLDCFQKWSIVGPPSKSDGIQNPLRVRGRTQQSVSARFSPLAVSQSCTAPYLTSPFFMLSHWVSVSAGNPAIAVARKVGVLGAPEIENGSPFSFHFFFQLFQKSWKNMKPLKNQLFFMFLAHQNGSKNDQFHLHGRSFLAPFFRALIFWCILVVLWLAFGSLWLAFGSLWLHFGSLWFSFGSFLAPFGSLLATFG